MALSLKVKSLLLASSLAVLSLIAVQESVQAEPVVSSYYGGELAGSPTASGEPFDPRGLTAAHPSLPLGTMLTVGYNGQSVNVRVNDRGPHVAGRGLDLSLGAAQTLGLTGPGTGVVDIKPAGAPEAKPPAPESKTTEPTKQTRVSSAKTQEKAEEHRFLTDDMLNPPGKRIVDYVSEASSPLSQEMNTNHGSTFFEEPPAKKVPETKEGRATQTLYLRPTVPGRRRSA